MKKSKPKGIMGRPTIYSQEIALQVCKQVAQSKSLRTIASQKGMPGLQTILTWLSDNEDFRGQYVLAKGESMDAMAEEILDISDETIKVIKSGAEKKSSAYAQAQRLRVDTRKWLMSKLKPKKYGDNIDVTSGHKPIQSNSIVLTDFTKNK